MQYNHLATVSPTGHASPDFQISRIHLVKDLKKFQQARYQQLKAPTATYVLSSYQHQKYEQHWLYCVNVIYMFARAASEHAEVDLAAAEGDNGIRRPATFHTYTLNLPIYQTPCADLGFCLTTTHPKMNAPLFKTYTVDGFVAYVCCDSRRDGFVYKRGPLGCGYYRDSGQTYELLEDAAKGETVTISDVVDGTYTMVVNVKEAGDWNVKSASVVVHNNTIVCPFNIPIDPETNTFEWRLNVNTNESEVIEFEPVCTLTFYIEDFNLGFEKLEVDLEDARVLPHPTVSYGPCRKQPILRERRLLVVCPNDELTRIGTSNIVPGSGTDAMALIESAYKDERDKAKSNRTPIQLEFRTQRPIVQKGGVIASHTFGYYSKKCNLINGGISASDIHALCATSQKFDDNFRAGCTHPRKRRLDRVIGMYKKSLQGIKTFGSLPNPMRGESRMYRESMRLLLDSLDTRYDFPVSLHEDERILLPAPIISPKHRLIALLVSSTAKDLQTILHEYPRKQGTQLDTSSSTTLQKSLIHYFFYIDEDFRNAVPATINDVNWEMLLVGLFRRHLLFLHNMVRQFEMDVDSVHEYDEEHLRMVLIDIVLKLKPHLIRTKTTFSSSSDEDEDDGEDGEDEDVQMGGTEE